MAYYQGLTYKKLQNYRQARIQLEKAVNGTPKIREALLELIEVLYQLNETAEAAKWIAVAQEQGMRPGETSFIKGLVEMRENKPADALVSFEKAKELQPALKQAADYQIALAHLKDNSFEAAQKAFQEVIVLDPNTDIARFADEYSKAIDRRLHGEKALKITAAVYGEYDDNVVLKPSDTAAVQDIGEEDWREVVTASVEYGKKINERFGLRGQYDLYFANQEDLDQFDLHSHTFGVVPSVYFGDHIASAPVQYNFTWVDGDSFLGVASVNPLVNFKVNDKQIVQVGVKLQDKDFQGTPINGDEDRDAFRAAPGAGWFYFFSERGFFAFRYEYDVEDAEGQNWAFDGNRANVSVQVPLTDRLRLILSGDAYVQDFDNVHTVFRVEREDKTYSFSASLTYQLAKQVDLQLRYTHVEHESNISIYDYNRNVYGAGVVFKY